MDLHTAVGLSDVQIKGRLWEREINKEAWLKAKGCRQAKALIEKELSNELKARLMQLSANILVSLITWNAEENYHRYKT